MYHAGQTAPGASTYTPWQAITASDETANEPTALAVPSGGTWVVAYVTDTGVPKLFRYQPPVSASNAEERFIDLPMRVEP